MLDLCGLIIGTLRDLLRSRSALEAEVLVLRQQIIVLRRAGRARLTFSAMDRFVLGWLCALFPSARSALSIVQPETVLRWHRAGFRAYWRWKSRRRVGRPAVSAEVRQLIRAMSVANPLWGAPRVHGELLKLGIASARRAWRSTWCGGGGLRHKVGGRFCAITQMASPRWICLWCRPSRSAFSMDC
jgi:hypothetical protein